MQGSAGFGFAMNNGPVDRYPAAVLRQQRTVHIQRTPALQSEHGRLEHGPVVKRKQKVGIAPGNPLDHSGYIWIDRRNRRNFVFRGGARDAVEPDRLGRVVFVCQHQRHVDARGNERAQAAYSDIVVAENDGSGHCGRAASSCFCSSNAWMMKRGRSRTC